MSKIEKLLSSTFCSNEQVGHLDGYDNGAYVITKEEMDELVSMISKKSAEEILALHKQDRAKVNSQCDTLINMSTIEKYLEGL